MQRQSRDSDQKICSAHVSADPAGVGCCLQQRNQWRRQPLREVVEWASVGWFADQRPGNSADAEQERDVAIHPCPEGFLRPTAGVQSGTGVHVRTDRGDDKLCLRGTRPVDRGDPDTRGGGNVPDRYLHTG